VFFLLLVPLPRSWQGSWQGKTLDFGHVPLFAALTLALQAGLRRSWILSAGIALAVAGLGEVLQELFSQSLGRSGNLADFLRGAAGALAAGLLIRAGQGARHRWRLLVHGVLSLALIAYPLAEVVPSLIDAGKAYHDFPVLCDGAASAPSPRWECQQSVLPREDGVWGGRVEFLPGPEPHPGVALEQVVRDWRGYRRLSWSFLVEGEPLELVFSVRDGPDAHGRTSHYQVGRLWPAGKHTMTVNLALAAVRAEERPLNLSNIAWVQVFVEKPKQPRGIRLLRIWLE
jgi:hypothetical protein